MQKNCNYGVAPKMGATCCNLDADLLASKVHPPSNNPALSQKMARRVLKYVSMEHFFPFFLLNRNYNGFHRPELFPRKHGGNRGAAGGAPF